jgi:hypothetical protein
MDWIYSKNEFSLQRVNNRSRKTEITAVRDLPHWPRDIPLTTKVGTNFADKRQSLARYSSLADKNQGVIIIIIIIIIIG